MGSNFFEWDQEPDDEEKDQETGQSFDTPPEAPPPAAPAAPAAPEGVNDDDQEYAESEQDQANNQEYAQAESKGRSTGDQEREAKRVGAVASRELAWGMAQRAVGRLRSDDPDVMKVMESIKSRSVSPFGAAQDLRMLASGAGDESENLHNAADKLVMAAKQEAEAGTLPRGTLPLSSTEASSKAQDVERKAEGVRAKFSTAGILQAPVLRKELADLENQGQQLKATEAAVKGSQGAQPQQDQPPSPQADISAHLNATPGGYKNYLASVDDVVKQLNQAGINVSSQNLLEHVPLSTAMAMILKTSDPDDTSGWRKFLSQMQDPSGRGEPGVAFNAGKTQGDDPALMEIKAKQQRYAQVMSQLGNLHQSQNWLSAIGMFITAVLVGPKAAIMIWGRAAQEHSLRTQLQFMHQDIQQSLAIRTQQQNMDYKNRSLAARQQGADQMEGRRETAALTRIYLTHQLALERAKQSHGLKDQDAKDLTDEFKRHMQMSGQALHEGTDPTQFDQAKKDMAMKIYHHHANEASKINDMLSMPETKKKTFTEKKSGVPAGQP